LPQAATLWLFGFNFTAESAGFKKSTCLAYLVDYYKIKGTSKYGYADLPWRLLE
jgi:hypothetical protein